MSDNARTEELRPREDEILRDLESVGVRTSSVSALRTSGVRYRAAVPVLLAWLDRVDDPRLKDQLVRALSVPWAGPEVRQRFLSDFRELDPQEDPTGTGMRWTIGNALNVLFSDVYYDDYVTLVVEPAFGRGREMLALALGKSKRPEAAALLASLVGDPTIGGHAIQALSRVATPSERPALESGLQDPRGWVRASARRGLSRLTPG